MNNARKKISSFLFFCAALVHTFWWFVADLMIRGINVNDYWGGRLNSLMEVSYGVMTVLVAITILFVAEPFLRHRPFSVSWWYYIFWLTFASISVAVIGMIYLAAYNCGKTLGEIFISVSPIWVWIWAFFIVLMWPLILIGTQLGANIKPGKTRWDVAEKIIMGIASIWSCLLSTFGITIWNIFSFCPK
jgi:hypothetical protein